MPRPVKLKLETMKRNLTLKRTEIANFFVNCLVNFVNLMLLLFLVFFTFRLSLSFIYIFIVLVQKSLTLKWAIQSSAQFLFLILGFLFISTSFVHIAIINWLVSN